MNSPDRPVPERPGAHREGVVPGRFWLIRGGAMHYFRISIQPGLNLWITPPTT
jgi:hypothetical protein